MRVLALAVPPARRSGASVSTCLRSGPLHYFANYPLTQIFGVARFLHLVYFTRVLSYVYLVVLGGPVYPPPRSALALGGGSSTAAPSAAGHAARRLLGDGAREGAL